MVKYGYANTLEKMLVRVNFELLYLDKMSLAFDAKIMIYTIKTIFLGKGV
jgi:lipopolysaccharide/colanic/teichoic acid biosynthesis glycosyltransferase